MAEAARFPYVELDSVLGAASSLPYLPLTLTYNDRSLAVSGLVDSGATVNVLPFQIGEQIGAAWDRQTTAIQLTGNLAGFDARALVLSATVGQFSPVRLAFAWTHASDVPLILGQVNFFLEFDACFYRSQSYFDVRRKEHPR
ncbi:MAG: hypothetical protein HY260_21755 [Chloroflexi bacterium]|nr:hypothetical protein [Chloroflexota bacterium]